MNVPQRCRRVFACLAGHTDQPLSVRMTGKWTNRDLQEITRQSAADVRMRELLRLNPDLIDFERVPGHAGGALRFWIKGRPWTPAIKPARKDRGLEGTPSLFAADSMVD